MRVPNDPLDEYRYLEGQLRGLLDYLNSSSAFGSISFKHSLEDIHREVKLQLNYLETQEQREASDDISWMENP